MDHDADPIEQDLRHIASALYATWPAVERLMYIADYATRASRRALFADLSDSAMGWERAMAVDALHDARVALQRDWSDANEAALVDAYTRLRDVRAEALRRGVTL